MKGKARICRLGITRNKEDKNDCAIFPPGLGALKLFPFPRPVDAGRFLRPVALPPMTRTDP